jgi:hypothetical protein
MSISSVDGIFHPLPSHNVVLYGSTQRRNLQVEESWSFLEKIKTFERSLLRDNTSVEFFLPSGLNDPDEQNLFPIGYLFSHLYCKY